MTLPAIPYFMNYVIFFQDADEYNLAVLAAGGNLLEMTPRQAASIFGIPYPYPTGDMSTIPRGIYFVFPYVPGQQIGFPGPSGVFVDDTILTVQVAGQAGVPASIWPAGPDATFTWSGNIIRSAGAGSAASPPANACSQRRWAVGREISFEATSVLQQTISRDSSRVVGGHGFIQRGNNNRTNWNIPLNTYRTGLVTRVSWERVYVRIRNMPTTQDTSVWRCHGGPSSGAGFIIMLNNADKQLHVVDQDAIGTAVDKGAFYAPVVNEWFRLDILLRYGNGAPPTVVNIYVNGVNKVYINSGMTGMSSDNQHVSSDIGCNNSPGLDTEVEIDWDDWINADLPANMDSSTLLFNDSNFALDWLLGSHVRVHHGVLADDTNWTPAGETLGAVNQDQGPAGRIGTSATNTTTALAILRITSDMLPPDIQDSLANVLGPISALVEMWSSTADGSDGQLGYSLAGGADVLSTVNEQIAESATSVMYQPTGVVIPADITPFKSVHQKANNAANNLVAMLVHTIEYLGVWGKEDDPLFNYPISRLSNIHNSRYDNTIYGYLGSQPDAPVFTGGFTYVGNGTYQEITLPAPCHFLWIRPLTGGVGGIKFMAASLGAHTGSTVQVVGNVRMWYDFVNQVYKFSVTGGAGSECNVSGVSYQVIFFCDPGMRFCLATAFGHGSSAATPKANPLIASDFTPGAAFFQQDFNGTAGVHGFWYRGAGHTLNAMTDLQSVSGPDPNGANFSVGNINSFATLHGGNGMISALCWREADSGAGGCAGKMISLFTYTGNGTNPRTINVGSGSGRFPLFIMVCPVTAGSTTAVFRDPSHTGTQSSFVDSMAISAANGITATAADSFTVQSSINNNGTVYSVFIIWGDTAGQNNGTFNATYCDGDGPYIPPSLPSGDINVIGNGGLILNGNAPLTMLKDASGLYTLIGGKTNDTLIDRQAGQTTLDVAIPDPTWKTGYVGG